MSSPGPSVRTTVVCATGRAALAASAGCGAQATGLPDATGKPPPEWARYAGSWPSHNDGLANTRSNLRTRIDAADVSKLKQRWTFKLPYSGAYGAFTSNPLVAGGVVYLEDPDSDVFALDLATGRLCWNHDYHSVTPSGGPNGVALGYGLLYGETADSAFALSPRTGKQVWIRKLTTSPREGIDMAPQLYDGRLLVSTVPGSATSFYTGSAYGVVYALDAHAGKVLWSFSTVKGGSKLWGDPKANSGGGLWYPPAVDSYGRVFIGVGNPGPYPLTSSDPNARSRPGPNLYTDSLVALDGTTGKLLWYRQVTRHDLRDHDFQDSPILATVKIQGRPTWAVIGAGKSGFVVAFRAGAATVADNVVFTSTYDGTIYALSTKTGSVLWRTRAPAGINSFPAVTRAMLIVGTGVRTSANATPQGRIVAYSLPR